MVEHVSLSDRRRSSQVVGANADKRGNRRTQRGPNRPPIFGKPSQSLLLNVPYFVPGFSRFRGCPCGRRWGWICSGIFPL
jgi:hypothetical protein